MKQLVQEHRSLWRINHHYKDDAGDCDECKALWEKYKMDKESRIEELSGVLKRHPVAPD